MMATPEQIRQLLLRAQQDAARQMEQIRSLSPLTRSLLHKHLVQYVLDKYMLTPEDCTTNDFNALTDLSLAKSMQVSSSLVREYDIARSCTGTSSAMAKRVLLFLSIQKALGIELPAVESAAITTLDHLTDLVWNTLASSPDWADRLAP